MRRVFAFLPILVGLVLLMVVWIFWASITPWLRSAQLVEAITFLREYLLAVAILVVCLVVGSVAKIKKCAF
jgi:hypothetical protein